MGKHLIAHQQSDQLVVYQAYKPAIADFAVRNQFLGGDAFSYDRMSWIKPGFLWMMYRSGWAAKEHQERILALWIRKDHFLTLLAEAVPTTFRPWQYDSHEAWQQDMRTRKVRVQWDPDHDPSGHKLERRTIQLGLSGNALAAFGKNYIEKIEDITTFVHEQRALLKQKGAEALQIPVETVWMLEDAQLKFRLGMQKQEA
ncbi:DUF4291 domain-containing protein [Taibaiella koreensis]|uniref:DUF4291 domain-containing protein n=1 Tax=Taibaiella koreensis TaxID=1268548 RepID=UPI001968F2B8|nr:DUF4291 domain-containing protein [Taibaiella koreensis]